MVQVCVGGCAQEGSPCPVGHCAFGRSGVLIIALPQPSPLALPLPITHAHAKTNSPATTTYRWTSQWLKLAAYATVCLDKAVAGGYFATSSPANSWQQPV